LCCGTFLNSSPSEVSRSHCQAQRDFFGAHTYERVDRPRGEFFHTNWTGTDGRVASSTYTV
jgi:6-phosphogluconate dehydrogenase